jgi:hypothetical protein
MEAILWTVLGTVGGVGFILAVFAAIALARSPYRD